MDAVAAMNDSEQHLDEEGQSVYPGLVGPATQFLGRMSLLHVDSSTLLTGHSLGFVRFRQVAAAIAAVIAAVVPAFGMRDYSIV